MIVPLYPLCLRSLLVRGVTADPIHKPECLRETLGYWQGMTCGRLMSRPAGAERTREKAGYATD